MRAVVSATQLFERLRSVKVLDATWFLPNSPFAAPAALSCGREAFEAGPRIPGARFWDLDEHSDGSVAPETPHNLPDAAQFSRAAALCGLDGVGDSVVCYDACGTFSSPRLWHTLRAYGFEDVAVLDGGLPAWLEAGFDVEAGPPPPPPLLEPPRGEDVKAYALAPGHQWVLADVRAWLDADEATRPQLIDARPEGRFRGTAPEPRPGARSGHAPGSTNAPFLDVLDAVPSRADGGPGGPLRGAVLKRGPALAAALDARGVARDAPCALTCGSGLTAAVVKLALHDLGHPAGPIYDGAWCEYEADGNLPVALDGDA